MALRPNIGIVQSLSCSWTTPDNDSVVVIVSMSCFGPTTMYASRSCACYVPHAFAQVFDMLLRRYLSLRDGGGTPVVSGVASTAEEGTDQSEPSASAAAAAEQHAVMASVVVLAERLGARVFGTGMQMLSCIRLVLEHEQPPLTAGAGRTCGGGGDGYVDAAERVAQMEEEGVAAAESNFDLGSLGGEADGDGDNSDDTLCSVVLALLTTVLELGEGERKAEEEAELRAMLGPLKVR